jgi:hypothetical protein
MKPIAGRTEGRSEDDVSCCRHQHRMPPIDCNYQSFSLARYYGGPADNSPSSFLNISRDYFQREARRNFLAEVAFFLVMAAILAAAFVEGARAMIHFLHLPAA